MIQRQHRLPRRWLISELGLFVIFAGVLGYYEYAENFSSLATPLSVNVTCDLGRGPSSRLGSARSRCLIPIF